MHQKNDSKYQISPIGLQQCCSYLSLFSAFPFSINRHTSFIRCRRGTLNCDKNNIVFRIYIEHAVFLTIHLTFYYKNITDIYLLFYSNCQKQRILGFVFIRLKKKIFVLFISMKTTETICLHSSQYEIDNFSPWNHLHWR